MPAPERTSLDAIIGAASDILETNGLDAVTMQAVAVRVGVKAPSLYKRVADRDALVRLVADAATEQLAVALDEPATLAEVARAFRAFARAHPQSFRLIFSASADPDILARTSAPVLRIARDLAGEEDALRAARLLTAWAVGFVQMELAGAFQLGGELDEAFEYGLRGIERAITGG
jgi:AcrR family transcriptional regulator